MLQTPRLPRSGIRAIADIAAGRQDVANLLFGEPDFATPASIVAAGMAAIQSGRTRYAPGRGLPELRDAASSSMSARTGSRVSPDHITVTAGGVQGLFAALAVLAPRGSAVLVPDPGWPNYTGQCRLLGLEAIPYRLKPENGWAPDAEALDRLIVERGARTLVLNTPSNPAGAVFDRAVIESCVALARRHDLWLIADEVYDAIVFEGEHVYTAVEAPERTVAIHSCSKTYAMTGWRVGYVWAPPDVARAMGTVLEIEASCASTPGQVAATSALRGSQDMVTMMRGVYAERRNLAVKLLADAEMLVSVPHGAFYVLADISRVTTDTVQFATDLASRPRGVACAPGEAFGEGGGGLLRVSLAADSATLEEGIRRLIAVVHASAVRGVAGS